LHSQPSTPGREDDWIIEEEDRGLLRTIVHELLFERHWGWRTVLHNIRFAIAWEILPGREKNVKVSDG
jgi:hypothetical protein